LYETTRDGSGKRNSNFIFKPQTMQGKLKSSCEIFATIDGEIGRKLSKMASKQRLHMALLELCTP
jgi:hypothetical protein